MSAADDLGLTPQARAGYLRRLESIFAEGCAIFGQAEAARLFRNHAKAVTRGTRPKPPRKQKGGHDPDGDKLLLQSWKTYGSDDKTAWARMALKNHAVKHRGKVRGETISARSMVRKLDRLLQRETNRNAI